jgi:hypothetical protein
VASRQKFAPQACFDPLDASFDSLLKVKYKKTAASKTAVEGWLECDGQKDFRREVNWRTLKPKIKSGAVARVLLKRVYNEYEKGVYPDRTRHNQALSEARLYGESNAVAT